MCGIAGAIGTPFAGEAGMQTVDRQLDLLEHRGPDARGVFSRGTGAIGQNRLAVIDLQTGDPPIVNEDETVGAVLNGEIYNFAQLRGTLRERGHRLGTRGDTEVIAHLAEELDARRPGPAPGGDVRVRRLGRAPTAAACWAATVWARSRSTTGRARGALVFGSEIKAVLAASRSAAPAGPRGDCPAT